jgi:hypothetical protein
MNDPGIFYPEFLKTGLIKKEVVDGNEVCE